MSVWKLGCRWGSAKPPLFFDLLIQEGIVIGNVGTEYAVNDLLLLTDGHTSLGIALVTSEPEIVTECLGFQEVFDEYKIDYNNDVFLANA